MFNDVTEKNYKKVINNFKRSLSLKMKKHSETLGLRLRLFANNLLYTDDKVEIAIEIYDSLNDERYPIGQYYYEYNKIGSFKKAHNNEIDGLLEVKDIVSELYNKKSLEISYLKKVADLGHVPSMHEIAMYYYDNAIKTHSKLENNTVSFSYWKKAVEQKYLPSYQYLGKCYRFGYGTPKSFKNALFTFKEGALLNDLDCIRELGILYYAGNGEHDFKGLAFDCFKKGAELGDATCLYYMGLYYEDDVCVDVDYEKSFEYYSKAAEKGYEAAADCAFRILYEKEGFSERVLTAAKKVSLKNGLASYVLGLASLQGINTVKSEKDAFFHFRCAAELGNLDAMYQLATCYYYGKGCPVNRSDLFCYWIEKAASLGSVEAKAYILIDECERTSYSEKDLKKLIELAKQGSANGACGAGKCYEFGYAGVKLDLERAYYYYKTAADGGSKMAKEVLKKTKFDQFK